MLNTCELLSLRAQHCPSVAQGCVPPSNRSAHSCQAQQLCISLWLSTKVFLPVQSSSHFQKMLSEQPRVMFYPEVHYLKHGLGCLSFSHEQDEGSHAAGDSFLQTELRPRASILCLSWHRFQSQHSTGWDQTPLQTHGHRALTGFLGWIPSKILHITANIPKKRKKTTPKKTLLLCSVRYRVLFWRRKQSLQTKVKYDFNFCMLYTTWYFLALLQGLIFHAAPTLRRLKSCQKVFKDVFRCQKRFKVIFKICLAATKSVN